MLTLSRECNTLTPGVEMTLFRCDKHILLTTLVLSGCGGPPPQPGGAGFVPPVPVSVATVVSRNVPVEVSGIGTVEAHSVVSVKAQIGGELTAVHFTEGQDVRQGSLLFEIDPRTVQADVSRAQANLDRDSAMLKQAEANLARDTAQLRNAEIEETRYRQLIEKGVAPRERYDAARTNLEALQAAVQASKAAIENARQAIRADQAAMESFKIQQGYTAVRAPIDGRTGSILVQRGNVVKANETVLVVINKVHPIFVNVSVPENALPEIRRFMAQGKVPVAARIPNDSVGPAQGILTFVDNAVDPATGTIRLKAAFSNEDSRLWPGQFVNVAIRLTTQPNAIVVPSQAVQTGQQGQFVFVVKPDQTAEARPVKVGKAIGEETVIESGLKPEETIVTDGQLRLFPGAKVVVKDSLKASS
jgi:multidrug efflux system membrane fusion protein